MDVLGLKAYLKAKKGVFSNAKRRRLNKLLEDINSGRANHLGHEYKNVPKIQVINGKKVKSHILPKKGKNGENIKYTAYDLNPKPKGSRDKARIIVGSDGSVWSTNMHYKKGSMVRIN